jgi:hypothetical protein
MLEDSRLFTLLLHRQPVTNTTKTCQIPAIVDETTIGAGRNVRHGDCSNADNPSTVNRFLAKPNELSTKIGN